MNALSRTIVVALTIASVGAMASSHREAPFVTEHPKIDAADFYMFRSYEQGRQDYVTLIANYLPLQDGYGGPNYFTLDPDALYEIHIDNNGDAVEDITFQFRFTTEVKSLSLPINGVNVPVPLVAIGAFGTTPDANDAVKNVIERYTVGVIRGPRRASAAQLAANVGAGGTSFRKPYDNVGAKTIPDYPAYARSHIQRITVPGCAGEGRVFAGQRKDPFAVNLGEVFDLVNTNPLGPVDGERNVLADKNVTTLALELPASCLTAGSPIFGAWTTASLRQAKVFNPAPKGSIAGGTATRGAAVEGGAWTQVSRLSAPLVNEVVIGLPDKDRFNASEPRNDAQFATYVTNPTLPELIKILFNVPAPSRFPRTDLVSAFLTGLDDLNKPATVTAAEMMRLNTSTPAVAAAAQNNLGALGSDLAGFPNGRRPGDDVVDIALRVMMGALLPAAEAPIGQAPLTDGALQTAAQFDNTFPYLTTPIAGSGG